MLLNAPPPSPRPPAESAQRGSNCFSQSADPPGAAIRRFGLFYRSPLPNNPGGGLEQRDAAAQMQWPPLGSQVKNAPAAKWPPIPMRSAAIILLFVSRFPLCTVVSEMKWRRGKKQFGSNIFHRAVTFVSNSLLNNAGPLQFVFSHLDLAPTSLRELHITNITNVAQ